MRTRLISGVPSYEGGSGTYTVQFLLQVSPKRAWRLGKSSTRGSSRQSGVALSFQRASFSPICFSEPGEEELIVAQHVSGFARAGFYYPSTTKKVIRGAVAPLDFPITAFETAPLS